jgi:hypothetical protein
MALAGCWISVPEQCRQHGAGLIRQRVAAGAALALDQSADHHLLRRSITTPAFCQSVPEPVQNNKTRSGTDSPGAIDSGVGHLAVIRASAAGTESFSSAFCGHGTDNTSDGTSASERLPELHAAHEIRQIDPTWAIPARAARFSLPALRRGRDQRGRARHIDRVEVPVQPPAASGAARPVV